MVIVIKSDKEAPITELFVFIATDNDGNDGIVSTSVGPIHAPMVTSKRRVVEMMKLKAAEISRITREPITLLRFSNREEIETFGVSKN
jgi:hypothetical protein